MFISRVLFTRVSSAMGRQQTLGTVQVPIKFTIVNLHNREILRNAEGYQDCASTAN